MSVILSTARDATGGGLWLLMPAAGLVLHEIVGRRAERAKRAEKRVITARLRPARIRRRRA